MRIVEVSVSVWKVVEMPVSELGGTSTPLEVGMAAELPGNPEEPPGLLLVATEEMGEEWPGAVTVTNVGAHGRQHDEWHAVTVTVTVETVPYPAAYTWPGLCGRASDASQLQRNQC
jgi:hypothetical protein